MKEINPVIADPPVTDIPVTPPTDAPAAEAIEKELLPFCVKVILEPALIFNAPRIANPPVIDMPLIKLPD